MKDKENPVTCFMWYVFNRWNESEAKQLFGEDLGAHIYGKYLERGYGKELLWYSDLDTECRAKLVQRALEIYQ